MRDLYKRIGLYPHAAPEQIHASIGKCADKGVRVDAEAVLLNPQRRTVYDHTHRLLSVIGRLRAELGLNHTPNWRGDAAADFTIANPRPSSRLEHLRAKLVKAKRRAGISAKGKFVGAALMIIGAVVFVVVLANTSRNNQTAYRHATNAEPVRPSPAAAGTMLRQLPQAVPTFTAAEIRMPINGKTRHFALGEAIAPLKIRAAAGSYYLVKLVEVYSDETALDVFIHSGSEIEVDVPLGTYEVRYASGEKWYGYEFLFGPATSYTKADKTFTFQTVGNQISGFTLTLYKVAHGNLSSMTIRPENF